MTFLEQLHVWQEEIRELQNQLKQGSALEDSLPILTRESRIARLRCLRRAK